MTPQTLTISQAAEAGLVSPQDVDPHDFAPYCSHDTYRDGTPTAAREPLFSCAVCDVEP